MSISDSALTSFRRLVIIVLASLSATAVILAGVLSARSTAASGAEPVTRDLVLYLVRSQPTGADAIVSVELNDDSEKVIFEAPDIREFAVAGDRLAVVTEQPDRTHTLQIGTIGSTLTTLVSGSIIARLHGSPSSGAFGFTSVRPELRDPRGNPLFVVDPAAPNTLLRVSGVGGVPVEARNWDFVPGTDRLVVHEAGGRLVVADPIAATATRPVGEADALWGFVPSSTTMVVSTQEAFTAVDLAGGAASSYLDQAAPAGTAVFGLVPRAIGTPPVVLVDQPGATPGRTQLLIERDRSWRELRAPTPGSQLVWALGSPDARYVTVAERAERAEPVNGAADEGPDRVWLVDVASGSARDLQASFAQWES